MPNDIRQQKHNITCDLANQASLKGTLCAPAASNQQSKRRRLFRPEYPGELCIGFVTGEISHPATWIKMTPKEIKDMKFSDVIVATAIVLALVLFTTIPNAIPVIGSFAQAHGFFMSFFKFAILCTLGELVALRITTKKYIHTGFGFLPRFITWGVIGLVIHTAFIVYATGTPSFLLAVGFPIPADALTSKSFLVRLGLAFSISTLMNILFAPLFMTVHGILSMHIEKTGGTTKGFFSPIHVSKLISGIDWSMLWGFVFKKTIPFFWIPAHTITFLLPPEMRVLFAAFLGVALGIILAFASLKNATAPA